MGWFRKAPKEPEKMALPEGHSSNYPGGKIIPPQGGSGTTKPEKPVEYEYRYDSLWFGPPNNEGKGNNRDDLNKFVKDGWEPVREIPLGVGPWNGGTLFIMAILLRRPKKV